MAADANALLASLSSIVGAAHVITDEKERQFYSSDVYSAGAIAAAVVRPGTKEELAKAVKAATEAGFAVVPRGGGMSYTSGYTPAHTETVTFDLSRLNRIVEVNTGDMYVVVEAGVTWKQLYEELKPKGVRTPFFGTLSGIHATVGGTASQGGMFFGSGQAGAVHDSILGLEVVLADGSIVRTGQFAHVKAKPFFRNYGPDLTGMFLGDAGALALKATVSLRLQRIPAEISCGSFAFDDMTACMEAITEIAREGITSELMGFDPVLQSMRMRRESLMKDVKTFANVVTGQTSITKGLIEGAKMALAGRSFMDDVKYSIHLTCEDRTAAGAEERLNFCRNVVKKFGGREIENTIPKAVRAYPFTPLNNMLGPAGERWLPVHGLFPLSDVARVIAETHKFFDQYKAELEAHKIEWGYMFAGISNNAMVFEPVFYWPDQWMPVQRRTPEQSHLAKLKESDPNPAATAAVHKIKQALCVHLAECGAAHFQIGKAYLYKEYRDTNAWSLLEKIKTAVDPKRLVNPKSLGLE
jgi:FAD/FMN-containing dehydrogenase